MLIGLVGKPSAGKSTFFKALTLMDVGIANYPFTTIKPNTGVGFVKVECAEKDFSTKCNPREGYCVNAKRFVPVQVIDVAGLVPGAHEGKGIGLEFLNDLSQADALIHIVDISGSLNEKGEPVEKCSYDPANDINFLEHELDMWYYQIFQRAWRKFSYTISQTKEDAIQAIAKQFSGLRVTEEIVKKSMRALGLLDKSLSSWTQNELGAFATSLRKKTKPLMIAANKIDVPGAYENYARIKEQFKDYLIVACSAESELALREAAKKELLDYIPGEGNFLIKDQAALTGQQKVALDFIKKNVLLRYGSTGVQDALNKAVFALLEYIAIFPAGSSLKDSVGRILPDCLLMPKGTTALDLAYSLHTDIGKGFIRAVNLKTKIALAKNSILQHRDVVEIIHNK